MRQYDSHRSKHELWWGETILRCYSGLWLGKADNIYLWYLNFMRKKREEIGGKV